MAGLHKAKAFANVRKVIPEPQSKPIISISSDGNCCSVYRLSNFFDSVYLTEEKCLADIKHHIRRYSTYIALTAITSKKQKTAEKVLRKLGFIGSRRMVKNGMTAVTRKGASNYNKVKLWHLYLTPEKVEKALAVK